MILRPILRWGFVTTGSVVAILGYLGLANLQLTLNGSDSLPDTAYVQWRWPDTIWKGAIVAVPPPAVFGDRLSGASVVKRVAGLPGDVIQHNDGKVCVLPECFAPEMRGGKPFAPLLQEGVIPEGRIAIFGDAPDSFDSRYASFGLIPMDQVEAVGVALDGFPHWTRIAAWLGTAR